MRQRKSVIASIKERFSKKVVPHKMPPEAGLQTVAILAKNLRRLTPLLAFMGRQGLSSEQRVLAISVLGEELDKSEDLRNDVLTIYKNMVGTDVDFDLVKFAEQFPSAWQANRLDRYVSACVKIGIFEKEDLVNLSWIVNNWMQSPDAWNTAKSRLDKLKSPDDNDSEDEKE